MYFKRAFDAASPSGLRIFPNKKGFIEFLEPCFFCFSSLLFIKDPIQILH